MSNSGGLAPEGMRMGCRTKPGRKRILIIDDDPAVRQAVRMTLRAKPFEISEADTAAGGLEAARQVPPGLVICDLLLGGASGYDVLAELRRHPETAKIPLILITGCCDAQAMRRSMNLGADDFLQKPFSAEELLAAVDARLKKQELLEAEFVQAQEQLVAASRQADAAQSAVTVLHNVGNVLNSVGVSTQFVLDRMQRSKLPSLTRLAELLREHELDLGTFLTADPQGRMVPPFLAQLAQQLATEYATVVSELYSLRQQVEHLSEIVSVQQSYASLGGVKETVKLIELIEDSLRMMGNSLQRHSITVRREFNAALPPVNVEKHKVLQVLVNLLCNAVQACEAIGTRERLLTLRLWAEGERAKIAVQDTGAGITAENLPRLFELGFTTRKNGHGFGLYSGAVAAREMGGTLTARSEGAGRGATFTLELPLSEIASRP